MPDKCFEELLGVLYAKRYENFAPILFYNIDSRDEVDTLISLHSLYFARHINKWKLTTIGCLSE